ncbi:menaquinone biosynthetic enzyme MqnA/MqnD family protein [Pedobacter sp. SYP-B3415]|uniref:menaquinone biosynthetic enzyme MqnA/MqnD family protein n=1 Tax=Pedobacter sp. SYP-B3415 TaxID=2496641 RepID=UPI00101B9ECE|nr:menaquinone biosynthesis protein [Pedobacter sp. SYP-B3415]
MEKIRISAVSYTNTKPFIYGLEHASVKESIDLSLDIPADCAAKLIEGQVDVGLVPVAVFPLVPNANIIADYCIGSDGAVNSVFIFSQVPVHQIRTLRLDSHSRTSNQLARVLLKFHWKQEVSLVSGDVAADAFVLIGDRTFGQKDKHSFAYDLGEAWKTHTGLPFLYAAWIANREISNEFKMQFNEALRYGLDHRKEVIQALPDFPEFNKEDYLMNKLDFSLTPEKRRAMDLFLAYIKELENTQ